MLKIALRSYLLTDMITVHDIASTIEEFAPKSIQESYDNAGLQIGDIIILREYDGDYTGRSITATVSYVLRNCPEWGLMEGYCIIGF